MRKKSIILKSRSPVIKREKLLNTGELIVPDGVVAIAQKEKDIFLVYQRKPEVTTIRFYHGRSYDVAMPYLWVVMRVSSGGSTLRVKHWVFVSGKPFKNFGSPCFHPFCLPNTFYNGQICWKLETIFGKKKSLADIVCRFDQQFHASSFNEETDSGHENFIARWAYLTRKSHKEGRKCALNHCTKRSCRLSLNPYYLRLSSFDSAFMGL